MTRISPSLYPDRPKATQSHGTHLRSEYAQPIVTEYCSVVNEGSGRASEGANLSSSQGWHPQHTIPQAFERLNAPQIRRDALPPVWLMIVSALTCLFTLLVADALYSKFFEWMVLQ